METRAHKSSIPSQIASASSLSKEKDTLLDNDTPVQSGPVSIKANQLQSLANNSKQVSQLKAIQLMANNRLPTNDKRNIQLQSRQLVKAKSVPVLQKKNTEDTDRSAVQKKVKKSDQPAVSTIQFVNGSNTDQSYKKDLWSELHYTYNITISKDLAAKLEEKGISAVIYNAYANTVVEGFKPSGIQFSSVENGKVGSIYFSNGRIRLTHDSGPSVSIHNDLERYALTDDQRDRLAAWRKSKSRRSHYAGCKGYINNRLQVTTLAAAGQNGKLVEVKTGDTTWWHPSRGKPTAFGYALSQTDLNILANVAKTGSNDTLKAWMSVIPALSVIPVN